MLLFQWQDELVVDVMVNGMVYVCIVTPPRASLIPTIANLDQANNSVRLMINTVGAWVGFFFTITIICCHR